MYTYSLMETMESPDAVWAYIGSQKWAPPRGSASAMTLRRHEQRRALAFSVATHTTVPNFRFELAVFPSGLGAQVAHGFDMAEPLGWGARTVKAECTREYGDPIHEYFSSAVRARFHEPHMRKSAYFAWRVALPAAKAWADLIEPHLEIPLRMLAMGRGSDSRSDDRHELTWDLKPPGIGPRAEVTLAVRKRFFVSTISVTMSVETGVIRKDERACRRELYKCFSNELCRRFPGARRDWFETCIGRFIPGR